MIPNRTRIRRWLTIGVVLSHLIGSHSVVVAQEGAFEAEMLTQQAHDLLQQGRYEEAIARSERALAIREQTLGPEHPDTARSLNNLAVLYHDMGAYAKAEPLYLRALAIREQALGPEHRDMATSLNGLGVLYVNTGAYAKAEPLYLRALVIQEKALGPVHWSTALTLNNLAGLYVATGAYAKAEPLHQRALVIREQALGPEHPDTAMSLNNLASLYHTTGAYAKAESLYPQALAIVEKALGPEHLSTATVLNGLASLYHTTGAYAKAEPLYLRALAIVEKVLGPEHPDTAMWLNSLAIFRWAMNDLAAAIPLYERSQATHWKHSEQFLLTGSESRKQAYFQKLRNPTFQSISLSLVTPERRATTLGLTSVLQIKGRVLDAMSESIVHLRQNVMSKDRALFDELAALAQQQSILMHQEIVNLQPEVYRRRLQELASAQERLETELSSRSAEFRQQIAPITLAAVQAGIPKGAALVEWYRYEPYDPKAKVGQSKWGKPRYVAYVLKRDGDPAVVDMGEAEPLDQLVREFRTGLKDPRNAFVRDLARDLYTQLIKPLEPHLGDTVHLLISPDSVLSKVPFAALADGTGAYLATKWTITYLTTGRDLLRVESWSSTPTRNSVVIVANPDFGRSTSIVAEVQSSAQLTRSVELDRGGMDFSPLPGTAHEAKTLKQLLKVTDEHMLTQANATESRFKQIRGPKILHVATHGFFVRDQAISGAPSTPDFPQTPSRATMIENPLLRSGLALAGANQRRSGDNDDGILTAAEVAQMDLHGTQLVVLSACETGVGDVQNGEGVYGLRRALVLAGAESQVTSLWKVSDEATKDLMVDYYTRLLKGEGRSEALRNAQLAMMKSKDRAHPYYWAAFVPIGNWTPLAKSK